MEMAKLGYIYCSHGYATGDGMAVAPLSVMIDGGGHLDRA